MLTDSVLQTLRRSTHVPTIVVAHVFIYDVTLLKSGQNVFMYCIAGKIRQVERSLVVEPLQNNY